MGRGLGERQERILVRLGENPERWIPLPELADDPDDQAAMARARASVKALKRRGLVETMRMVDPDRLVDTASTGVELGAGWSRHYVAEPNTREWYGIWVRLSTTEPTRPLPRPPEL